jgi:hypothetical protein
LKKIKKDFETRKEHQRIRDWLNQFGTEQQILDWHFENKKPDMNHRRKIKKDLIGIVRK